jgi:hypothetical protein
LLLAGDGLLMVVNGIRFALLRLRVLSTLSVASVDRMLIFLMGARPFLAFRLSLGIGGFYFGAHNDSPVLNLAPIAAYLLRFIVHTVAGSLRIGLIRVRERVLILGRAVANPLGASCIGPE